jgi:hypothetical protein
MPVSLNRQSHWRLMTVDLMVHLRLAPIAFFLFSSAVSAQSLWDHNGSEVSLVAQGQSRRFYYETPSSRLSRQGVKHGDLLFEGQRVGNTYSGFAYVFLLNCPPARYPVQGTVASDQRQVTLQGRAPVRDVNCQKTGERDETLTFTLLQAPILLQVSTGPTAPAESYPIDAMFIGIGEEVRTDWWARNIGKAKSGQQQQCPFADFSMPCGIAFSQHEVITEEEDGVARAAGFNLQKYYRERRSLYLNPIPFAPVFINPRGYLPGLPSAATTPYPFDRVINAISSHSFGGLDEGASTILFWKYRHNMSFENIMISKPLEAAWNFWLRAARGRTPICRTEHGQSTCFKILQVTPGRRRNVMTDVAFDRALAVCRWELWDDVTGEHFPTSCYIIGFETPSGEHYVSAFVGPPATGGASADLTDSFGQFALSCRAGPSGFKRVVDKFQLAGRAIRIASDSVDIAAISRFQYFEPVRKFGLFKMTANGEIGTNYATDIIFWGKWWDQNINSNEIPIFEDEDVYKFKELFENVIAGRGSCTISEKH